jgi:hypothetical protein
MDEVQPHFFLILHHRTRRDVSPLSLTEWDGGSSVDGLHLGPLLAPPQETLQIWSQPPPHRERDEEKRGGKERRGTERIGFGVCSRDSGLDTPGDAVSVARVPGGALPAATHVRLRRRRTNGDMK